MTKSKLAQNRIAQRKLTFQRKLAYLRSQLMELSEDLIDLAGEDIDLDRPEVELAATLDNAADDISEFLMIAKQGKRRTR